MLDKEKIKDSLTQEDIILVLTNLGSSPPKIFEGKVIFPTICHNINGGSHKLYYYHKDQTFHCYTGCQTSYDIFSLVQQVKQLHGNEMTFYEAVQFVANITGKYFSTDFIPKEEKTHILNDWDWMEKLRKPEKPNVKLQVYDSHVMDVFINKPHELWINEGISADTMKKFNIQYYLKEDKIVIPHYNANNELVGIRGRALKREDVDAGKKYMPLYVEERGYTHPLAYNLYGLNVNKEAIKRTGSIMLFEAEKSVLKCQEFFGEDNIAVAVCGSTISRYHRDMILDLGVKEVIIAFDKEYEDVLSKEAREYAKKIYKLAKMFIPYVRTYVLWDENSLLGHKDSPADRGYEVLQELLNHKIELIL